VDFKGSAGDQPVGQAGHTIRLQTFTNEYKRLQTFNKRLVLFSCHTFASSVRKQPEIGQTIAPSFVVVGQPAFIGLAGEHVKPIKKQL
jgi:hypothetical protein